MYVCMSGCVCTCGPVALVDQPRHGPLQVLLRHLGVCMCVCVGVCVVGEKCFNI
jgi:hypothetical protein